VCTVPFGHCDVSFSSIYGFWLPLWYLQAPLIYFLNLLAIVLSVLLRFTDSDCPFVIFKLFIYISLNIWTMSSPFLLPADIVLFVLIFFWNCITILWFLHTIRHYANYSHFLLSSYIVLFVLIVFGNVYRAPVQPVPINTKVMSSSPVHGEVYSIQHYVIKFLSNLWQVGGFLRLLRFPPSIKLTPTI
jgi:hypothetical protein